MTRLAAFLTAAVVLVASVGSAQTPGAHLTLSSTTCPGSGCVLLGVSGLGSASVQVNNAGTYTLQFEASIDGVNFTSWNVAPANGGGAVTSTTAPGLWTGSVAGYTQVRVRASSLSSGTPDVLLLAVIGGGGGTTGANTVTIHDPNTPSQQAAVNGAGQLSITCANCSGSGASAVDESAFVQGTNSLAPAGGLYSTSYTALTSGHVGIFQATSDGNLFVNLFKVGSAAITLGSKTSANSLPVVVASDNVLQANGNVASGSSDSGNPLKVGGVFNTTQPSFTTGQRGDLQLTARGGAIVATGADTFHVTCDAGCSVGGTSLTDNTTFTQSTTAETPISGIYFSTGDTGYTSPTTGHSTVLQMSSKGHAITDIWNVAGSAWVQAAAGIPKVGITDSVGATLTVNADGGLQTHDMNGSQTDTEAATITQTPSTAVARALAVLYGNNGTNDIRIAASNAAPSAGQNGIVTRPYVMTDGTNIMPTMDAAARAGYQRITDGTNTMPTGDAATRAIYVKPPPDTPIALSALSNSAQQVVNAAAIFDFYFCWNPNAVVSYVQVFDKSAPTVGTDPPRLTFGIPPTMSGNLSAINQQFTTAIYVAATTTATGGTAPSTPLVCNFGSR